MLVSQILRDKGNEVYTASPHTTLEEASRELLERRIGAVVVTGDDGRVVGILSERDVVSAVARRGAGALQEPVDGCMTRDVVFAEPGETVDELMGRMTDRRIRHLPVCVDERLVGLVSIGDLVKSKISEVEHEADELKAYIAAG